MLPPLKNISELKPHLLGLHLQHLCQLYYILPPASFLEALSVAMVAATRLLAATARAQSTSLETRCLAISSKGFLQTSILSPQSLRSLPTGSRCFSNGKFVPRRLFKPLSNTIAQQSRSNARNYSSNFGYDPPSFRDRVRAFQSNRWVRRAPWIALSGYIIYLAFHIERVPDVDGRWRLMIIPDNSELVERYRYDSDMIESIQDHQLGPEHIKVQRARRVLDQLVLANGIGTVEGGMDWEVSVFTMYGNDDYELDICKYCICHDGIDLI